ncbi:MAG: TonB-dependent receptor [Saprospiraceae bacterium]|nr:TonB-dependent receptor [Saprospiraceae bacterium]
MNRFFNIVLFGIFALNGCMAFSQECFLSLHGHLKDTGDDNPLEFAYIYIEELKMGVYSDESGAYFFENICPGNYHLVISHLGCETTTKFINFQKSTHLDIELAHNSHLLEEIKLKSSPVAQTTGLLRNTITSDLRILNSGKNLSSLLLAIPGVSMVQSGPGLSKPVIHGMYGNRIVMLNQGIPQEGQQWGLDHAPEIDPNNSDQISVVKGASAIRYGLQAMGGVIILEDKLINNDPHWHGNVRAGIQSNGWQSFFHAQLKKAFKKSHISLNGGGIYGGDKKTPNYYLTNTGYRQGSLSSTYTHFKNEKQYYKFHYSYFANETGIFRGSHIGNLTDLKEALTRETPLFARDTFSFSIESPRQWVNHHLAKYTFQKKINEVNHLTVIAGVQANQRKEFDIRRGGRSSRPSLDLTLLSQFYEITLTNLENIYGFQYKQGNNINNPGTGISPLLPDFGSYQFAFFGIYKTKLKRLPVEFGVRSEYRLYDVNSSKFESDILKKNYLSFAANAGTRGSVNKKIDYFIDISYTGRPPEINELFSSGLHQGVAGIEEGNPELKPEQALKIVNEWNGETGKTHHVNLSFFGVYANDYLFLAPTGELRLTIRGAFPVFKYQAADVILAGTTFRSTWQPSDTWSLVNSLQYTYSEDLTNGSGLIFMPPLNTETSLQYTIGKTRVLNELKTGIEFQYFARQNNVDARIDFSPPPPDYFLTNMFLRLKWKKQNQHDIEVVWRVENLFDIKYRNYMNRQRYFADEPGRNVYLTVYTTF